MEIYFVCYNTMKYVTYPKLLSDKPTNCKTDIIINVDNPVDELQYVKRVKCETLNNTKTCYTIVINELHTLEDYYENGKYPDIEIKMDIDYDETIFRINLANNSQNCMKIYEDDNNFETEEINCFIPVGLERTYYINIEEYFRIQNRHKNIKSARSMI